ncbi:hypothetical protein ACVINW_001231 [Bradyrhizobium sp. USDA 4461]
MTSPFGVPARSWNMPDRNAKKSSAPARLWPLLAVNFFMADMQSGIGPFVGVFLQLHGWTSGLIGTRADAR